jgi:hypothetical protein
MKLNRGFKTFRFKEKLSPHPQVLFAFGLLNINPFPFIPPENSNIVPARYKIFFFYSNCYFVVYENFIVFALALSNFKS